MTLSATIALFTAMVVLALIPGPGIIIVVGRTLSQGFTAGIITSIGIITGDFIFIALSVYGLSTLSVALGEFFTLIRFLGAAYLIWLGLSLILAKSKPTENNAKDTPKHSASFIAGLLTTLSNPKAILFYLSFFPAFIDIPTMTYLDLATIFIVTTLSIGGVMLSYAYLANKGGTLLRASSLSKKINIFSGGVLISSGVFVATRASN